MKLKLVVAMSVLGLISGPVLADPAAADASATAQPKHKHHHHHKARKVSHHDYKAMGALPVQPAPVMEAMPKVDAYEVTMDALSQNTGRGHAGPDWFNHILINGGMNVDAAWGNRAMGYMGEDTRRVSVNDMYLNATALVNDWTKAFASISYNSAYPASSVTTYVKKNGVYSNAYASNTLSMEQAYVTFGNFDCFPFFAQVGKQFQPFGRYDIHPIERTMAQVLTESLHTSAEVGFLTKIGLTGAAYVFDNSLVRSTEGHTQPVYGAMLGFDQPNDQLGYDLGVGYMSSMAGVNDVATAINSYETAIAGTTGSYQGTVGAITAYGDINTGPFSLGARYVTSLQTFAANTLSNQYKMMGNGAKPWAADVTAGYGFNAWTKNQNVYVGYQASNNAVNIALPRSRWIAGYGIDVLKSTNLGLEYGHDIDYGTTKGGTGLSTNTFDVRAAVKFG